MALPYPEGTQALVTDSEQRSLVKIVELLAGGGGGGGTGNVTYHEAADLDPNGVVTGREGDVYVSQSSLGGDGSTWWKREGTGNGNNTGWGT